MIDWLWVHTPDIPATWEVDIRRIKVPGQPKQKVSKNPISANKLAVVMSTCNPDRRKLETLFGGKKKKGGGGMEAWLKSRYAKQV
jgi:hypothetical protein